MSQCTTALTPVGGLTLVCTDVDHTSMMRVTWSLAPVVSVTVKVTENLPAAVAVPVICPVAAFKAKP
jgi:hypothetical protein